MAVVEQEPRPASLPLTSVLHGWVTTVDHKKIGLMYIGSALVFLAIAGVEATLLRLQLFFPRARLLGPDTFNQVFTMHGTTMVFFVGMPILIGLGNYLVPLMIGARDMAFPRLNAFGFWISLFGGLLMYFSFLTGAAPNVGWFGYAPLTEYAFSRGTRTDYWILGLLVSGIGTIGTGVNFVATILTLRAPGMTFGKIPLFVWMMFFDAVLMLFALPPLTAALVMLLFDRQLGAHFFDTQAGGSALLWQHMFWFFGHPEVYILILPAFGVISEVIPVFSRKVIFGYESVALATVAIAFISLGVWAHHMFAVGMSRQLDSFFGGATFLIAIPTGIKVFNWVATLYGGRLRLATPMVFALGFLSMFVIGGLTGIILATVPIDWQLTDSYFVVAHFHYVLFGGTLFALMSAFYYWYPKVSGRLLSERLGIWHFWFLFLGFNLTFGPMHVAGLLGMPRRVYTYAPGRGWEIWNQLATLGVALQAVAFLLFVYNLVVSWRRGQPAGDDPWDAWTLEWATPSPPPSYNFETVPAVLSRRPLWDLKHPDDPDWLYEHPGVEVRQLKPEPQAAHAVVPRVGMIAFLVSEVAFFGTLIVAYLAYLDQTRETAARVLSLPLVLGSSVCLFASSGTVHLATRSLHRGDRRGFLLWWPLTILLGALFLVGTGIEWRGLIAGEGITPATNLFGTTYFTLVGFHAAHVTIGVLLMLAVLGLTLQGAVGPKYHEGAELVSWYWHFVDGVWVVVFCVVYLLGRGL